MKMLQSFSETATGNYSGVWRETPKSDAEAAIEMIQDLDTLYPNEKLVRLALRHPPSLLLRRDRGRLAVGLRELHRCRHQEGRRSPLRLMALADIKALPVGHLGREDAILLLWSTGAMLPQALGVLDAWARNIFRKSSDER